MFTTVMNRYQQEEPALKLFHLRNCLVGKAAGIIDDELVNNNDYEAAWKVLTQRYEDKRVVVDKHIENLFSLPKINQDNASSLRKVIDTCTKNVEALKNQNLPWPISSEQVLADPTFNRRGPVDMLFGAGSFWNLMLDGRCELGPNRPTLRYTKLGWIAGGVIASDTTVVARTLCQTADDEPLIELLRNFYKVESCDELSPSPKADDEVCLEHFRRTHERTEEGRYVVRYPFNERKRELGGSRDTALRRFLVLERKLDKQPDLKEQYSRFIREYEDLGHMREIVETPNDDPGSVFYLPHHCVLRPTSTTTKLRVVFDGSAKTSTGVSINDVLLTGPTVQNDLTAILLRFRGFQYVFTLDIPKMFRQVVVHPDDTRYQRIFWRYNRNDPLTVRELLTVTYGLGPSPFQATMALKQAAEDHHDEFPRAAEVVNRETYMDDILTGADTLAEACQLQRDVTGLLAKACFSAHKWCANHSDIVFGVAEEHRGDTFEVTDDTSKTIVKTLGVTWNPLEDWFSVSVPDFDNPEGMTRRKLLSQLAKIFDPLGFFGPVITYAKLILREVGELQIDWDDSIPTEIDEKWRNFRTEMTSLREIRVPRWISWKDVFQLRLQGFADASDQAYGACLYVQGTFTDKESKMQLVCSKSRILPKKRSPKEKAITTPRAELLAALLLARMVVKFLNATELKFESVHLWSDSKIVLAWVKKTPELLQTYVSNRNDCATKKITNYCVDKGIDWSFIPPRSPHFGGIWEAGVKQVKYHLKRIVGDRKLSYEELYTTLTQMEAVLNSRPLVSSSDDPSDYTAITPAHFLIGREMQTVPEPDYSTLKENHLSRWQLVQSMLQHFWKRWTAEYLPELQNRSKWLKRKVIKVGSLVLLADQNAPLLQWPLARIVAAHPGDDGTIRVVTVKTANGAEFKRAVTEVCFLPLDEDEN
ncbi:uncharacterized protein LOC133393156 [Anopheles gambiae]|uniref:uncharacterized protein LOC133393156 n=1 Tax=Anopheles gambiae TaxID=7165 RepID=UPI002AC9D989|nr:uncharacterized protein LOC133393156 [Anopheles gambiae]